MTTAGEGNPAKWTWSAAGDDMQSSTFGADISGNKITVYSHCLDGNKGGSHINGDVEMIMRTNADVVLLQDPGWNPIQAATAAARLNKAWSGASRPMWWKYWPGSQPKAFRHGVFVAVRDPWCNRQLKIIEDNRGWGRFGGVVLQGNSGTVAFISLYAPTFSHNGRDVQWQQRQIQTKLDVKMTPWELCRNDLRQVLYSLQK